MIVAQNSYLRVIQYALIFCVSLIVSIIVVSYAQPGTVSAACGVNSGNIHDFAGLVVNSRYRVETKKANGTTEVKWGQSENTQVKVTTAPPITTEPGGVTDLNTYKHYKQKVFEQKKFDHCGFSSDPDLRKRFNDDRTTPSGNYVVLGTGGSSTDSGNISSNWALDCDNSLRAGTGKNPYQEFSVTGVGVPNGVPGGGTWSAKTVAPPNGGTFYMTITYFVDVVEEPKEDDKPDGPTGSITCNRYVRKNFSDDLRFQFAYFAKGAGYNPPQGWGAPMGSPHNNPLPSAGRWNDYSQQSGWVNQIRNVKASDYKTKDRVVYSYDFPSPPSENWRGWRVVVERWQRTGTGKQGNPYKWNFTSNIADVNCDAWVLGLSSSADKSYVEKGDTVKFTHTVNNSGNVASGGVSGCIIKDNWCPDSEDNISFPVGNTPKQSSVKAEFVNFGSDICQRYWVSRGALLKSILGRANYNSPRESNNVCTKVVGGSTGVSASGQKGSLEPGESQEFTVNVHTSSFAGHSAWSGYNPNCTYNLIRKLPGQQFSQGTTIGASNRSCSSGNINGNGTTPTKVNYTATEADFGYEVCLVAQLNISNSYFRKKNAQGQDTEQRAESSCAPVIHRPYLNVQAGDISAGNGFSDDSCTMNPSASIISWNKNNASGYHGAGTTFASFAHNTIQGFASGQGLPTAGGYGNAPNKLAFANTTANVAAGKYGGDFGSGSCIPDYFGNKPDSAQASWPGWAAANGHDRADQVYSVTSSSIAGGIDGGDVNIGSNIRLYVNGDVYIKGDITPNINREIDDPADIPNFTLVAKGNIYIAHNVTELYGTYVAQPSGGSGGIIRTCTQPNSITFDNTKQRYDLCNKQLTVDGSLVADKILFHRTKGSLYMADGSLNNTAEIITYNPLLGLRQSTGGGTPGGIRYDSITTLPPVL